MIQRIMILLVLILSLAGSVSKGEWKMRGNDGGCGDRFALAKPHDLAFHDVCDS